MKNDKDDGLREIEEAVAEAQREMEGLPARATSEPPQSKLRLNGGFRFVMMLLASAAVGGGSTALVNSIWSDPAIRDRLELVRVHENRIDALERRVERCEAKWRER